MSLAEFRQIRAPLAALALGLVLTLAHLCATDALAQAPAKRGKGFVREPDNVFRQFPVVPRFRAFLPPEADLSARLPAPGNQGAQSSCTAWAVGYAMRSYYEGRHRNWDFSSPEQVISPAYIYNRLQGTKGNCDEGIQISSALNFLQNDGAATLALFPYSENTCSVIPAPTLANAAGAFRIRGWRALDAQKFDDAKGQIHAGNPVVFGMDISESFENLTGDTVYDDTKSPRIGGHAMVLVGYSERRQAFKVMNSWGTEWGDRGFGWVSYRALRELSDRFFVMDVAPPDPVALVVPTPTPQPAITPAPPAPVTPPKPVVPPVPVVVTPPEPPKPAPVVVVKPEPPKPAPVVVAPPEPPKPAPVVIAPPEPPKPGPVVVAPPPAPVVSPPTPLVVTPPKPATVVVTPAPPKPVVVAPPKPAPPPPIASVQREINTRLAQVPCARLEGTLTNDRRLRLRGFIGSSDDMTKLRGDLAALAGVAQVDSDATLLPWPQCEVQLSFDEALAAGKALTVNLRGGQANTFREGDSLAIEVVTPSYPSYLYVSYLQANGEVAHLSWPQRNRPVAPNTRLVFGGGGAQPVYRVSGPFGDEAIVVVASASPLFQEDLPETATDREYLTTFRRAFLTRPQGGGGQRTVAATVAPLKTQPGK